MEDRSKKKYIVLKDLEVYQLARELSRMAWNIYKSLKWQDQKIMGDQFITSADSVGANIAEGYARYHYLDKVKFYLYSRGSLAENSTHWLELLFEREKISKETFDSYQVVANKLLLKLNNFITTTRRSKQGG